MYFAIVIFWLTFAGFGGWIASVKNRPIEEGLVVGLLFGPFGCLVEVVLPTLEPKEPVSTIKPFDPPSPEEVERRRKALEELENFRRRREEEERRKHEEMERRRAEVRRIEREQRRIYFEWWKDFFIKFGWFRAMPDFLRAITIGLVLGTIASFMIVIWNQ